MEILKFEVRDSRNRFEMLYDPYTNLVYNKELESHFELFRDQKHPYQKRKFEQYPLVKEDVEAFVGRHNNRLVLDITSQCNLRCIYCIYNDNYDDRRNFKNSNMSLDVLKRSISFYKKIKQDRHSRNYFDVSFYGGEPSLNPNVIEAAILECDRQFDKNVCTFLLTTNGTFFDNDDLVNLIIRNKERFATHISLDGPKSENDRFRVFSTGRGVFDDVMRLTDKLKDTNLGFQITLHPEHDWNKIDQFYSNILRKFPNIKIFLNYFTTRDYKKKSDALRFDKLMLTKRKELQDRIIDKMSRNLNLSPFEIAYITSLSRNYNFYFNPYWSKKLFINSCYPGADKMAVNSKGDIFICERVSEAYKIGDVYNGLKPERILELWQLLENITESLCCGDCSYHNFCSQCFIALTEQGKGIRPTIPCNEKIKEIMFERIKFMANVTFFRRKK